MTEKNYDGASDNSFVRAWWKSRKPADFFFSLPCLLGLLGIGVVADWARNIEQTFLPAYRQELVAAIDAQNDDRAEIALNTLLQLRPQDQELRYHLAQLRFRQKRFSSGFSLMQELATENDPRAGLWLAHVLLKKTASDGSREKAIELLRDVVQRQETNAAAHALLGETYLQLGQWQLAEPQIEIAAKLDPVYWLRFAQMLSRRGKSQAARERAELAETQLRELVADTPANIERRIQWAASLRVQGKLNQARDVVQQGLRLAPEAVPLHHEMARIVADQAEAERVGGIVDFARYSQLLQQSLRLNPTNRNVLRKLVDIPLEQHSVDEKLLQNVRAELPRKPADDDTRECLAWILLQTNPQNERIFPLLQQAAKNHRSVALRIARFQRFLGDETAAVATAQSYLQSLRATDLPDVDVELDIAATLAFLQDWEAALEIFAAKRPDWTEADRTRRTTAEIRYLLSYFHQLQTTGSNFERQLTLAQQLLKFQASRRLAIAGLGRLAQQDTAVSSRAAGLLEKLLVNGEAPQQIHTQFGTNALLRHDYDLAARHLEQAIKHAPQDPFLCNNLAWALLNRRQATDLTDAVTLATRALSRLPGHPQILQTRGAALIELERYDEALHDLEAALAATAETKQIHSSLAAVYARLGNDSLARQHRARADGD